MCEALKNTSGSRREEELQEEVTDLRSQLELVSKEQAALLKAELAAARATWNRDKQQEVAAVQQACQEKLQEQSRRLEQAREEAARQEKELLLQMEARLLQRTEEQRRRLSGELLAELRAALADVQVQLLADEQGDGSGAAASEGSVTHILQTSCRDAIGRAVAQAKDEWRKVSWDQTLFHLK